MFQLWHLQELFDCFEAADTGDHRGSERVKSPEFLFRARSAGIPTEKKESAVGAEERRWKSGGPFEEKDVEKRGKGVGVTRGGDVKVTKHVVTSRRDRLHQIADATQRNDGTEPRNHSAGSFPP